MKQRDVCVLGAGGHAKVVIRALQQSGFHIAGVFDDDVAKHGQKILGITVSGTIYDAQSQNECIMITAIGDNYTRRRITENLHGISWTTAIHPRAWVDASVIIGPGTVICAGAIIQAGSTIGKHVIVNSGATVDHDCTLVDYVHVAPGCHLGGNVTLEEGCFMGIGSVAIPGQHLGAWSIVGAGGVVINDISEYTLVAGVPAKLVRKLKVK